MLLLLLIIFLIRLNLLAIYKLNIFLGHSSEQDFIIFPEKTHIETTINMSLNVNFVLQKSDMRPKKQGVFNGTKTTSISCSAKELNIHNKKNLYQVLSLESQDVSFHELKKAYRAKALQLHPDVYPSSRKEECTELFVELREAYEVLSDPNSRRIYDLSLVGGYAEHEQKEVYFSTRVWEMQLEGLKKRSANRSTRRNVWFA